MLSDAESSACRPLYLGTRQTEKLAFGTAVDTCGVTRAESVEEAEIDLHPNTVKPPWH